MVEKDFHKKLGFRLKIFRLLLDKTTPEFAAELEVEERLIELIESGLYCPSIPMLIDLWHTYQMNIQWFIFGLDFVSPQIYVLFDSVQKTLIDSPDLESKLKTAINKHREDLDIITKDPGDRETISSVKKE
ncbi:MAG: helix-turn-helix transcriptional regulator [bacterium]|nr:helix-turn-helix transcriptional regulator [bacterium]